MEIVKNKKENFCLIKDLNAGDVFEHEVYDGYFLKLDTKSALMSDDVQEDVVSLTANKITRLSSGTRVKKVNAKLVIE